MRIDYRLVFTAALMALGSTLVGAESVADRLPQETRMAFWVDDIGKAREDLKKNPFYNWLSDEKKGVGTGKRTIERTIRRIPMSGVDPLQRAWPVILQNTSKLLEGSVESSTMVFDFSANDVADTFTGPVAIFSTMFDLTEQKDLAGAEWDVIFEAKYLPENKEKAEAFLQRSLKGVPPDAQKKEISYQGISGYRIEYYYDVDDGTGMSQQFNNTIEYAWVKDYLILCEGRSEPLRKAIRALTTEGDEAGALSRTNGFKSARTALGESHGSFHVYVDAEHYVNEMKDVSLRKEYTLLESLGLVGAGPLMADCSVDDKGASVNLSLVSEGKKAGIFSVISNLPALNFESLGMIPSDADTFALASVDGGAFLQLYRTYNKALQAKKFNFLEATLANSEAALGADIENDLINQINGEAYMYARTIDRQEQGAVFVPYRGGQETALVADTVLRKINSEGLKILDLDENEFEGRTVWESKKSVTQNVPPISLAATPKGFVESAGGDEIRGQLRRLSGNSEDSMKSAGKIGALNKIDRDGLKAFVYTSAQAIVDTWRDPDGKKDKKKNEITAEDIARSHGDTYWTLNARPRGFAFKLTIEPPPNAN